jgi:hypothetical protein
VSFAVSAANTPIIPYRLFASIDFRKKGIGRKMPLFIGAFSQGLPWKKSMLIRDAKNRIGKNRFRGGFCGRQTLYATRT